MDAQGLWWLGIALAAGVVEVLSLNLVFLMVAGGALVAAVVAALTGNLVLAVMAFAGTTGLLLVVARPPLVAFSRRGLAASRMGVSALVGRRAEVLSEVTGTGGQVKLAGEVWSARTSVPGAVLEVGSPVEVLQIEGATAVVSDLPPTAGSGGPHPIEGPEFLT